MPQYVIIMNKTWLSCWHCEIRLHHLADNNTYTFFSFLSLDTILFIPTDTIFIISCLFPSWKSFGYTVYTVSLLYILYVIDVDNSWKIRKKFKRTKNSFITWLHQLPDDNGCKSWWERLPRFQDRYSQSNSVWIMIIRSEWEKRASHLNYTRSIRSSELTTLEWIIPNRGEKAGLKYCDSLPFSY